MAEDQEELDRLQLRVPKGGMRVFLRSLPEGTRSKFCIDAIQTAIAEKDFNYLKKYEAELEIELKKVRYLLNFKKEEDLKSKKKLLDVIENPAAQDYFLQYHNRLNPERPYKDDKIGITKANSWLEARIYDFQAETGSRVTPLDFKELYEEWKELKVTKRG